MELGIIKGYEVNTNKDSTTNRLLLQIETIPEDIRTVELISQAGEDTNPAKNCRVVILEISKGYQIAIGTTDDLESEVDPGEKEIYSTDSPATEKKAKIKLTSNGDIEIDAYGGATLKIKADGNVEINGTADFAVAYTDLKSAFDTLKTDLNNLITLYNAHIHPGVTAGGASTAITASQGTASSADMSGAKIDTVKMP